MNTRIDLAQADPQAYNALIGVENYIAKTDLNPIHKELIKIRTSQINGCGYCINMHTAHARQIGETEQRIYLLSAWRESTLFTEEEQAILALTEEVALISNHVSDETYQNATRFFDQKYLAQLIMMMISINSWNRFAILGGKKAG